MNRVLVLRVALVLAVAVLVAPFLVYAYPPIVGADNGYVVVSGSMEPTIGTGDVAIVTKVPPRTIAVGDVITYRSASDPDVLTTHRVVGVERTATGLVFLTKGDANEDVDPRPVAASRVVGTVTLVIPLLGHVVVFAQRPIGVVLLLIVPAALLVLTELRDLWTAATEDDVPASADDDGGFVFDHEIIGKGEKR